MNFSASFRDLINTMGTRGEYIIIGSVVNTFLTAYPECETVFLKADGNILESGHNVYDFELAFFS